MSPPLSNRRGIVSMLVAMAFFVTNDTALKLASTTLPPGQIMAIRGLFASLFAIGLVAILGESRRLGGLASPKVLLRASLEAAVAFLYITSLAHLPLANILSILQATPIIMTLIAVVLGLERVGWRRWCAVLVGFAGVLLIVKPTVDFNVYSGLALASAALVAARDLVTRSIGGEVPSIVVTLSTTSAVSAAGFALAAGEVWQPLDHGDLALLGGAALVVTLGNLMIIQAFRLAEVAVVSPFRYSIVPMSILMGFLVFQELPDLVSVIGIGLIMTSGLYTLHREHTRTRAAIASTQAASPSE